MKNKIATIAAILIGSFSSALGQTTQVDWTNFSSISSVQSAILFRDADGTPLSQGAATANTDGMLVQLGYFTSGTASNNFAGTWTPLTGFVFSQLPSQPARTAIGDSPFLTGSGNGVITFNTTFTEGSDLVRVYTLDPDGLATDPGTYLTRSSITITSATPPNGQILAIRFYNSPGDTGLYNTVSADNWTWQSPTAAGALVSSINLASNFTNSNGAPSLEFEDAANPFLTTIPEPSTYMLFATAAFGMLAMRKLKSRRS